MLHFWIGCIYMSSEGNSRAHRKESSVQLDLEDVAHLGQMSACDEGRG